MAALRGRLPARAGFIQRVHALPGGQLQARLGDDVLDLADATANVVLRRASRIRTTSAGGPPADRPDPRIRLVLTQPPLRWTTESLSFAYHATALVLGADAAATLPLEGVAGPAPRPGWGWEAAALERGLGAVRPILAPDARAVVMLEPGGPEALVAGALGGVGAGYRLTTALLAEADELVGGTLEFTTGPISGHAPRAGLPACRAPAGPRHAGRRDDHGGGFQLSAVERDVTETAVAILRRAANRPSSSGCWARSWWGSTTPATCGGWSGRAPTASRRRGPSGRRPRWACSASGRHHRTMPSRDGYDDPRPRTAVTAGPAGPRTRSAGDRHVDARPSDAPTPATGRRGRERDCRCRGPHTRARVRLVGRYRAPRPHDWGPRPSPPGRSARGRERPLAGVPRPRPTLPSRRAAATT